TSIAAMTALALYGSARETTAEKGRAKAFGPVLLWFGLPAVGQLAAIIAAQGGVTMALASPVPALRNLLAPASPVSPVLDTSWVADRSFDALRDRLLLMMAMQAGLIVLAVSATAGRLEDRDPRAAWLRAIDPFRGYRPPCGDDPIYWREYELPNRVGLR